MVAAPREIRLDANSLSLSARAWGPTDGKPVLALHGWLNNAASFDPLARALMADPDLQIVALDLPGHGHSEHRAADATYPFADWIGFVHGALDSLGWERCSLLGHSLGAGIAVVYAGTFPERIERLVLVEGIGPLTTEPEDAPQRLATAVEAFMRPTRAPRVYDSLDAACDQLLENTPKLSRDGARILVEWGTEPAVAGGVRFRHDPRLRYPSPLRLTEAQVHSFIARVTAPALVFVAEEGLPHDGEWARARLERFSECEVVRVPGHHHVHLDSPELLRETTHDFLSRS